MALCEMKWKLLIVERIGVEREVPLSERAPLWRGCRVNSKG